jgi:hypothetical protein
MYVVVWSRVTHRMSTPRQTVSSNKLDGDISTEIGLLSTLQYFFASANNFTPGIIPESFSRLLKLQELGLKTTNRIGGIPSFLGSMTELILLDLDDNNLYGPLPPELGQLVNLQFLLLNRNQLYGTTPLEFSGLISLRVAFLDRNSLVGSLAPLCDLPTFNEADGDLDGRELITADCDGGADPETDCECCTSCCNDLNQECNDYTSIPHLDPRWEFSYSRFEFTFGTNARYIASTLGVEELPPDLVPP